ncbi:MAG: hypothetical protein ACJ790_13430 [Myxococcaceae bacterium]
MRSTLQLVAVGCFAVAALGGCRQYEGRAALEKVASVQQHRDDFRDDSIQHGQQIKERLDSRAQARASRLRGYVYRHSDVSPRELQRDQKRIEKLRTDSRTMAANSRNTFAVTDIVAGEQLYGTVKQVRGDRIDLVTQNGPISLQAAQNSRVTVDGREVSLQALPPGAAVKASFGNLDGTSYFYEVALR